LESDDKQPVDKTGRRGFVMTEKLLVIALSLRKEKKPNFNR